MAERQQHHKQTPGLVARSDQPLIGIPVQEDGQDLVHYFTDEKTAQAAARNDSLQKALSLAGAWQDLMDWEEAEHDLERIRHESPPTPPIEL